MKLFKLTDKSGYTRLSESGETRWKKGFTLKKEPCDNPVLCSPDVIHAYTNANLAFLLNPAHAALENPQLWEAEGEVVVKNWGKVGCFSLTTVKKLPTLKWFKKCLQNVQIWFAILCAEAVLKFFEDRYPTDNRPRKAIEAAKKYLKTKTAHAAANAANAAHAAADAAYAARAAAYADAAADAAHAAAYAADATAYAAYTATAYAANAAAYAAANAAHAAHAAAEIDFGALADKAVELAMKGETI